MVTLGRNIRFLRLQKEWNQEDMAQRLSISIPAYAKIENGITDVHLSRLEQIAALFDMSVVKLLRFDVDELEHDVDKEIQQCNKRIEQRETELIELQKKVIELIEKVRYSKYSNSQSVSYR